MDATYWKERCERAEEALLRARSAVWLTPAREQVVQLLGNLKEGETLDTEEVAAAIGKPEPTASSLLCGMYQVGLVDRRIGRRGLGGEPSRWKLAHLVQVKEPSE